MTAELPHPNFADYAGESVPQSPVGAPSKDGWLDLTFGADADGQTHLIHDRTRAPFHVSGTLATDPHPDAATVMVQSSSGGIVQGDRHDITIMVDEDAIASVTTGSATKVFSMEYNYGAAERSLSVRNGGHLAFVPAPTILHSDARYCETTTLTLERNATAILAEVVVPGRLAHGERFDFERYLSRLRVRGPDGLLFEDTTHLHPTGEDRNPTAPGVLGECAVYGTLYIATSSCGAGLSDRIHERVADRAARAGATELPNNTGVVVRALDNRTNAVTETLRAAWDEFRMEMLDAPAPERGVW
jgi:urease accessory protein